VLAHLVVGYIVLVAPWLSRYKYRQLQGKIAAGDAHARLRFYRIAVVQQVARILVVLTICALGSIPRAAMGLTLPSSWQDSGRVITIFLVALALATIFFRYRGDWQLRRLVKMVGALIPISAIERYWFALVALGAGVSEEVLFRGFLMFYLDSFLKLGAMELIVVSSLLFGFCHIYQGWFGVLGTTLAGFCLAFLYVGTASLVVPIAVHAVLDLRLLLVLTPKRLQSLQLIAEVRPAEARAH
jgi:uncharacterized protein